jgi:hypothetical protein
MKQALTELFQATVAALLIGGPFFYYFIFMMKP